MRDRQIRELSGQMDAMQESNRRTRELMTQQVQRLIGAPWPPSAQSAQTAQSVDRPTVSVLLHRPTVDYSGGPQRNGSCGHNGRVRRNTPAKALPPIVAVAVGRIVHSADHARAHVAQPCTQSCSWSTRVVIRSHRVLSRLVLMSSHVICFAPLRRAKRRRTHSTWRSRAAGRCVLRCG